MHNTRTFAWLSLALASLIFSVNCSAPSSEALEDEGGSSPTYEMTRSRKRLTNETQNWPGLATHTPADDLRSLKGNWSGLFYSAAGASGAVGTLWGVRNGPSELYKLKYDSKTSKWQNEKVWTLRYKNGGGEPDAEDLTFTDSSDSGVYIATERDGKGASRLSVLRFDPGTNSTTHEWNLTHSSDPQSVDVSAGANEGFEAIAWIPDSFLVANSFFDASLNKKYNPADYPKHGNGLFFLGLEANGFVYAYALNSDQTFKKIAAFTSGFPSVMGLSFDPSAGYLWALCDNTCSGRMTNLKLSGDAGAGTEFKSTVQYKLPSSLPNSNYEGFAILGDQATTGGLKKIVWADDSALNGVILREGALFAGAIPAKPALRSPASKN